MNNVALIGNITRDPEMRYSTGEKQTAILKFSIAVNDGFGESKRTSFLNITAFGKLAENCEQYLKKGSKVGVTGRIQTGSYEKDGRTVYTTDIVADKVDFLSVRGEEQKTDPSGFTAISDDDIPWMG